MEHNNLHDFLDVTSPRYQVELMEELESVQGGKTHINLQFEEGQNPFSYYEKENRRDMSSSEDDRSSQSSRSHENLPESSENHNTPPRIVNPLQKEYPNVQVGQNLSGKEAVLLSNAVIKPVQEHEGLGTVMKEAPPLSIRLVKQVEVDLSSFPGREKTKKSKEKIYRNELNNDMQELKDNIKNKNNSKIKQGKASLKNQLYKTFSPAVSPKGEQESSLEVEQLRMLIKMGFQKKKTNYTMLKEWDRKRAETLALHGRMIQLLQGEVDLRIKSSLENFEFYQTFFREKAKQQEKYVTSAVINTRYALQNNSLSKNVYINCSIVLNELCEENVARCKNISSFIQLIRVNILKELTEQHFNNSQKELLTIREKISCLKCTLNQYNTETELRAKQLATLFEQQSQNITNKFQEDFYRTQISFLRKAQQQIETQAKLGEYCLEYYHTAIKEEYSRSEVIRDAMLVYTKGLRQAYGVQFSSQEMQQMSKHEEPKLIEQFYALGDMFDEHTFELFKLSNGIKTQGDISLEMFTTYIKSFSYDYFDSRVLLLKQYSVRYVTLVKSKQTTEEPCYLVITVDNFLHLFFMKSAKAVYPKPDVTLKITCKYLQFRGLKQELVDVVKKQEKRNSMMSYFWDNRIEKVYRIRFSKKDSQEQFLDCVNRLSIDH